MATQTIPRLELDPGDVVDFLAGDTYVIEAYTDGDWNGSSGNLVSILSSESGTAVNIQIPADISVSYVSFKDCAVTGGTIAADATCIDGGGNSGITFPGGAGGVFFFFNKQRKWS